MLKITKQGKSLIVEGVNHSHYPFNDTLTYPMNSVAMTIDKGDIITFKSAANGDVLFSSMIDSILINDAPVTKEDIKTKFDMVSNVPQGGGGGGTGAVNSVNGQQGDVVLSASDVNAYSKQEIDNKGYLTAVPDNYATDDEVSAAVADKVSTDALNQAIQGVEAKIPSTDNLATKNELNEGLELKADKTTIADMATKSWVGEQDYATNTLVESKLDKNTYNEDKATFALKSEIPSIEGLATQEWVGQQGYLNAIPEEYAKKTDIDTAVADKVSTTALNQAIEGVEAKIPSTDNLATKAEISDMATMSWVNGKGYSKTIKLTQQEYDQLPSKDADTLYIISDAEAVDISSKLDKSVYDADKANFATKDEIPSLVGYATQEWVNGENFLKEVPSEYITETELSNKNYATVSQLPDISGKQDTLVNQVNIKSINGQTLLGEGNIDIQGGGGTVTVDAQLSTESENPVQNKIITNELNKKVESLEITQEEYNALEVKDPNVMYIITDAPEVATQEWVNGKGYLTKVKLTQQEYDNLPIKDEHVIYIITDAPEVALKSDLTNLATKDELNSKADASAIPTKYLKDVTVKGNLNNILSFSDNTSKMQPRIPNITLDEKDVEFVTINGKRIFNFGANYDVGAIGNLDLATKTEIANMATQAWVTEQINAAIAQVNEKITEINNKIV